MYLQCHSAHVSDIKQLIVNKGKKSKFNNNKNINTCMYERKQQYQDIFI